MNTLPTFNTQHTTTLNRASQATIPKAVRTFLGLEVGDRIVFEQDEKTKTVTITKEPSLEERLNAFHNSLSPETKARIKKISKRTSKMSVSEMMDEWRHSESGQKYYTEKYGVTTDV